MKSLFFVLEGLVLACTDVSKVCFDRVVSWAEDFINFLMISIIVLSELLVNLLPILVLESFFDKFKCNVLRLFKSNFLFSSFKEIWVVRVESFGQHRGLTKNFRGVAPLKRVDWRWFYQCFNFCSQLVVFWYLCISELSLLDQKLYNAFRLIILHFFSCLH